MHALYDTFRKHFLVIAFILSPVSFLIDAPFGRFAPEFESIFVVDGVRAWILMEILSPIAFVYALVRNPLASSLADATPLGIAQLILSGLFLTHYINRAIISPLRTPSRSKTHIIVTVSGMLFNIVNGTLMGTYLRTNTAASFANATPRPVFWAGIATWAVGFAGNIMHDEILFNIRRNAKARAKSDDKQRAKQKEYYGIPHGYLYTFISYPNYLCEWIEWTGYAIAAAPLPAMTSLDALVSSIQPPWIFLIFEILHMFARAYKGHQWYLNNFPDYPKNRKVVIPYIF